ncbi:MAG TPA: hypothetical protein VMF12_16535, partial [Xanthobacteraceae bacterium]|nr:hypothetical protein [Xanthobacteraceae bacterium]
KTGGNACSAERTLEVRHSALRLPSLFGRQSFRAVLQNSDAKTHRENEIAFPVRPRQPDDKLRRSIL